jgi:hypothetical protein
LFQRLSITPTTCDDPLAFWWIHKSQFPNVGFLSKQILGIFRSHYQSLLKWLLLDIEKKKIEYSYMHIQLVVRFMFEIFSNIWPTLVRTLKGVVLRIWVMWSTFASHWAFIPRMAHFQSFPTFDNSLLLWKTYNFN